MDLTWSEIGRRGLWECELPNGQIPGGVRQQSNRMWVGWVNTGVETSEYRSRVAAQAAVERLVAAGARPTARPESKARPKVWRRVPNEPDPGPRRRT